MPKESIINLSEAKDEYSNWNEGCPKPKWPNMPCHFFFGQNSYMDFSSNWRKIGTTVMAKEDEMAIVVFFAHDCVYGLHTYVCI